MKKNAHLIDLEECCKLRITAAADLLALLFDHLHLGDVVLLLPLALELRGFLLRLRTAIQNLISPSSTYLAEKEPRTKKDIYLFFLSPLFCFLIIFARNRSSESLSLSCVPRCFLIFFALRYFEGVGKKRKI